MKILVKPDYCLIKEITFLLYSQPYLDSNIPFKLLYVSVASEILRIAATIADLINVVSRTNLLLISMKKQGGEFVCIILL